MTTPTLNLIGAGGLGRVLARLWLEAGVFRLLQVLTRSHASALRAVDFIGAGEALRPGTVPVPADVWLIATGDSSIGPVAEWLAREHAVARDTLVFHCSGALDSTVLAPLRLRGASLASAHPVHSFAAPDRSLKRFAGSACALEGDRTAVRVLRDAFERIDAVTLELTGVDKSLYHAGTVIAANYLVVVLEASLEALEHAGVSRADASRLLAPLVHAGVDNVLHAERGGTLTGPVARGEVAIVREQLAQLSARNPALARLYAQLGEAALSLAEERGNLSPAAVAGLVKVLKA